MNNISRIAWFVIMDKDNATMQIYQSDFTDEIRRLCRTAVDRFGGIRKFATTLGEDENTWFNRLTDGRCVGFDVSWFLKVLLVTKDYHLLIPFFKQGKRIYISAITDLCNKLNYTVLPNFKCMDCKNCEDGSTYIDIQNLLKITQKLLQRGKR